MKQKLKEKKIKINRNSQKQEQKSENLKNISHTYLPPPLVLRIQITPLDNTNDDDDGFEH